MPTPTPTDGFVRRHIGPDAADLAAMCAAIGVSGVDELIDRAVPSSIRDATPLELPDPLDEQAVLDRLREHTDRNQVLTSLIGMGYTDTITPAVIQRNVLEDPAWYTAYTPYQPEISQGRLEALLNFQTMVSDLTGMALANASLLDEATAAAEAMTMLRRVSKMPGAVFVVDHDCHPQTIDVVATRAEPLGIEIVVGDPADPLPEGCYGVLVQYPGSSGRLRDLAPIIESAHDGGALVAVAADILALVMLVPPGEVGADCVVGSTQRFGVPLGFGGPHAAYIATHEAHRRSLPGRLVGVSVDTEGRPALRLALQTREQHIRRERATSNICTAQVLLAVIAGLYATYHGPEGLRRIAERVHGLTATLAARLRSCGETLAHDTAFDTLTVVVPGRASEVCDRARGAGFNLRMVDADTVGITLDETSTLDTVEGVLAAFEADGSANTPGIELLSPRLRRTSDFCTHPVFTSHHSETEILRYLRYMSDRDIALDRSMIPLGSCTMKLNATTEMVPITWPELADIHPFAPADQTRGYRAMIDELEQWLVEITGYDAASLQPNAGSQGELAGLMAIRAHHRANGDLERDVCLIPASAHGTNAASAVMAGMRVVVVDCDDDGNVDLIHLEQLATDHDATLAAIMVTYPSTHGVFEEAIGDICEIVHRHGGQVYLDGANLNAMVGLARPGRFGADVSHLNLHKTFCIPHGGGGPGVGPVVVRSHLAPYLPNHPVVDDAGPSTGVGAIAAAPWGSAGILAISWTYIAMMGASGLTDATKVAITSANYLAARLGEHFPILYTAANGTVAHECIVDLRPLTASTGVTIDDVAKRLIDYGFHAPTVSFPVAGTLMIEPTESEPLTELDRFCDAMIAIRTEIAAIERGDTAHGESPLAHAPHTAEDVTADEWVRTYSRSMAAYPTPHQRRQKYWPPVSRIDAAHGDKNLVCACPDIDAYR